MKKSTLVPLIVVIAIGLGFAVWKMSSVTPSKDEITKTTEPTDDPLLEYADRQDEYNLTNEQVPSAERAKSLRRLAMRKHPIAQQHLEDFWQTGDPVLQAAATEAAGFLGESEANRKVILSSLFSDSIELRKSALIALSRFSGADNQQHLQRFLKTKSAADKELRFLALKSLLRVAVDAKVRDEVKAELLYMAQKPSHPYASQSLVYLLTYAPDIAELLPLAKSSWENFTDPLVWTRSLQFLSAKDPDWTEANLSQLPVAESTKYITVLIDTLNKKCPEGSIELFSKISKTKVYSDLPEQKPLGCP